MPMPSPSGDESRQAFVSRCMRSLTKENEGRPDNKKWSRDQMAAICFEKWKNKSSRSEMMTRGDFMKECMKDKNHTEEECMKKWKERNK